MTDDALIHLRVPAATKGRWVRASRAAGKRLTDWITEAVEAHMAQHAAKIVIPEGLDYSALKLARDPDGAVSFDWTPVRLICEASGIDVARFREAGEDALSGLLVAWYREHLSRGGARDAVQDDLLAEVEAEERIGQRVSLPPGCA